MTSRTARFNLKSAAFPLLSELNGRSIITRAPEDTDYIVTDAYSGYPANRDIGIPQMMACENVMPTSEGYESVGFSSVFGPCPGVNFVDRLFTLRTGTEQAVWFIPGNGANYIYSSDYPNPYCWAQYNIPATAGKEVTTAWNKQRHFVMFANLQVYEYYYFFGWFLPVTFTGLTIANILGVCAAHNYTIAYNEDTIFWSSVVDPTDFVPSLSSGAGSEKLGNVRGKIVIILPIADGFVIYTTANAVLAQYSGNIRHPWTFREIAGSGGITTAEHVSHEANLDVHFAWTTSGLQRLSKNGAECVFPEVTDFITGRQYEYLLSDIFTPVTGYAPNNLNVGLNLPYNASTEHWRPLPQVFTFATPAITFQNLRVKIAFLAARYLVISYGDPASPILIQALIYDSSLRRWGKIALDHYDCFEYTRPPDPLAVPGSNIGFLCAGGEIKVLTAGNSVYSGGPGQIIFGRLQHVRGRTLTLSSITIDGSRTYGYGNINLDVYQSYDGKTWEYRQPAVRVNEAQNTTTWKMRFTAEAHMLRIRGSFQINSIIAEFHSQGRR